MPGLIIIIILSNKHQEDFVGRVLKTLTFPLSSAGKLWSERPSEAHKPAGTLAWHTGTAQTPTHIHTGTISTVAPEISTRRGVRQGKLGRH